MIQDINFSQVLEHVDKRQLNLLQKHMIKVALTEEKLVILSQVSDENELFRVTKQDSSFFEQLQIMSSGLTRGEKQFSFEHFEEETGKYYLTRAYYAEELYQYKFPCFYLMATEVTGYKKELLEAKSKNVRFELLTDTIPSGILMVEAQENLPVRWANSRFYQMLGYTEQEFCAKFGKSSFSYIEKEDQKKFIELIHRCNETKQSQSAVVRIANQLGEIRWFNISCERTKENQSRQMIYCVFTNVTDDVQRNQELKSFQERYKMVLSVTSEIVFEYDFKNNSMHYFGGDKNSVQRPNRIENFVESLKRNGVSGGYLTEESIEELEHLLALFVEEKEELADTYLCYEYEDGRVQWMYLIGKCIYDANMDPEMIIGKISDMTSYKEEEKKLLIKASTDSLTKVSNRDFTVDEISRYLSSCSKNILPTLLVIDVDDFKNINNNYGHTEGDHTLAQIAEILKCEFRSTDVIGRIGGDEFVVFLKDIVSDDIVYEKAGNVCRKINEQLKRVSVSIGVSIMAEKSASFEKLYRSADIALYQAKERGKNTYVCYHDLSDELKRRAEIKKVSVKELTDIEYEHGQLGYKFSYDRFTKSVLGSYDYLYAINLSEDKVQRFDGEHNPKDEHSFKTYTEMFEHLLEEIFDQEEKKEFINTFRFDNLVRAFLDGEHLVHGYFRVFDDAEEFHWYFTEAILHETDIKDGIHCTFLLKDVQKSRSKELKKYETQTKTSYIRQLEDQKSLDTLTGVFKPKKFYEEAKKHLWSNTDKKHAIISFDIDRFRVINDIYSEEVGDQIICYIADVLRKLELDDKVYGRYYADCFSLMLSYQSRQDIIEVIDEIVDACLDIPFISTTFKMSFGVYVVSDHSTPIRLMCDWARLAGRTVKGLSMQYYAFYNEEYRNELVETQKIEAQMHKALKNNEFKMYLQPKYDLRTNEVVGAEALVRWYHPQDGIIYPNKFIPLFEKNGFILQLDEYMWEQACMVIREWQKRGIDLPISVNISRLHTYDPALVNKLTTLVHKYGIPVEKLELEFTEGLFMENVQTLYSLMNALKEQGFVLQMDDFGSGYSSLNMLKSVPIDVIKLDKVFFEDMLVNERGKIIIENSIKMIHDLNLKVMAEGIESKEHVDFLNQSNCVTGQGYYYAKPMPLDEFYTKFID